MKWLGRRGSDNVEDRRGMSTGTKVLGGGGVGTIVIVLLVWLLGGDPSSLIEQTGKPDNTGLLRQQKKKTRWPSSFP